MTAAAITSPGVVPRVSLRVAMLPWSGAGKEDKDFRRILLRVLAVCALISLITPLLPTPKEDREHPEELPPHLAKLLLEREPIPPPPPAPKPERLPEQAVKSPIKKPEAAKPTPVKPEPILEARKPIPDKTPGELLENARKKASGVGLLAMKDELADLRGAPMAVQLNTDIKQGPGVGTGVGPGVGSGIGAGVPTRSLITSNATNGSGGINTAGFSRDTGGGGLAGRSTTLVAGVAGGRGGGGPGGGEGGRGGTLQRGTSGKASRSIEDIKLVFERNKGAIYAIYNRALREDPALEGKVVLELKIAPSGQVLDCKIISSDLHAVELEGKLLARIKSFDFGAKDVELMIVTWPVDFLPS